MPAVNDVGEPCAGERHARFEVAGAGNGAVMATENGSPRETGGPEPGPAYNSHRASARPYTRLSGLRDGHPRKCPPGKGFWVCRATRCPDQEGTYEVNATSTVPVRVEGGGDQVVAHVGLHALGSFADRLGLGEELSAAVASGGDQRVLGHDRGKVLTQMMLMLAGGGECCRDIEYLRSQPGLFGSVPSDSTVWRTFARIDETTLGYLRQAMGDVRSQVWSRSAATTGIAPVVLDIDASLVEIHSENKEGAAVSYKGGYGFHPMFCFADATGEALAALLRPGNAAANSIDDHLAVLDEAIAQLPEQIAAGHGDGDDSATVAREIRVRADSAGCSTRLAAACRARNVGFSVVARSNRAITAAVSVVADDEDRWAVALDQDGDDRDRSGVVEVTNLVDLSWRGRPAPA